MKNKIYLIIGLIVIIGIMLLLFQDKLYEIDMIFNDYISVNLHDDFLIDIMIYISFLASPTFLIILSVILLLFFRNRYSVYLIYNLVSAFALNILLKFIVQRQRPINMLITEQGYSFPSGHAMVATVFYGLIIYLVYSSQKNQKIKVILTTLLVLLILLISFSRIYLAVHYLSDVYSGIIIGVLYLIILINLMNKKIKFIF